MSYCYRRNQNLYDIVGIEVDDKKAKVIWTVFGDIDHSFFISIGIGFIVSPSNRCLQARAPTQWDRNTTDKAPTASGSGDVTRAITIDRKV